MNNYWAMKYWEEHHGKRKKNHPIELDRMLTNEYILSRSHYRRLRGNSRGIVLDDALLHILRDSDISVHERRFLDGRKKEEGAFIQRIHMNQEGRGYHFELIYSEVDGVLEKCIDFRRR